MGHTPSTAGTFQKKFRKNSGKTPKTLSERFLEFPSRVRLGCPKPYNARHLRLPEQFQSSLLPSTAGDASFFRSGSGQGLSEPVMEFPTVLRVFLKSGGAQICSKLVENSEKRQRPEEKVKFSTKTLTLQSLLFWKKQGFFPKKARVFLFAEPLKSLEKRGKTHKKARKIGKRKKQGNRKKQGLEGQGRFDKFGVPLIGTPKNNRRETFWTNLGSGHFRML